MCVARVAEASSDTVKSARCCVRVRELYSEAVAVEVCLQLRGGVTAPYINELINGVVDGQTLFRRADQVGEQDVTSADLALSVLGTPDDSNSRRDPGGHQSVHIVDAFTAVITRNVSHDISSFPWSVLPGPRFDALQVAIARNVDRTDSKPLVWASFYKNVASLRHEAVLVGFRGLFVWVEDRPTHVSPDFYLSWAEVQRAEVSLLKLLAEEVTEKIDQFSNVPSRLRSLRSESQWCEERRLRYLQLTSHFDSVLSLTPRRARTYSDHLMELYGLPHARTVVSERIDMLDKLVANRLASISQWRLGTFALWVGVATFFATLAAGHLEDVADALSSFWDTVIGWFS
jgi:hypothetical protein